MTIFSGRFLNDNVSTKVNRVPRVQDGPIGAGKVSNVSCNVLGGLHAYVLLNNAHFIADAEEHRETIKLNHPNWSSEKVEREQKETFVEWCRHHVDLKLSRGEIVDPEVTNLLSGPLTIVTYYNGYGASGYKFEIESIERIRATQNSGVATLDNEGKAYFGVLENVIAISYRHLYEPIYIFECRWYDTQSERGTRTDDYGLTLVNTQRTAFEYDKYILPEMATQIYYSRDVKKPEWSVVCHWKPRDYYNLPIEEDMDGENDEDILTRLSPHIDRSAYHSSPPVSLMLVRDDLERIVLTDQDFVNPPTIETFTPHETPAPHEAPARHKRLRY